MAKSNRELAIQWLEENWNTRRVEVVDELWLPSTIRHLEGSEVHGPSEWRKLRASFLTAFPDVHIRVDDLVAEGNQVVARWHLKGTHRGKAFGIPATGRSFETSGMTWFHFENGRIIECWDAWNQGALRTLLGGE